MPDSADPTPLSSNLAQLSDGEAASTEHAEPASSERILDEPAPARSEFGPVTGPQRYMVQFTATPEHVELVAHNALAAEEDFGRAFFEQKRTQAS